MAETEPVKTKWMVMIYMAGDNNLSENMAGSFKDFGPAFWDCPRNSDVAVLVYFDGGAFGVPTFYCDFTNPAQPEVEYKLDSDSSRSSSIGSFFGWCQKRYTADYHMVSLSGHSDGFRGISLFKDDSSGHAMERAKLSF